MRLVVQTAVLAAACRISAGVDVPFVLPRTRHTPLLQPPTEPVAVDGTGMWQLRKRSVTVLRRCAPRRRAPRYVAMAATGLCSHLLAPRGRRAFSFRLTNSPRVSTELLSGCFVPHGVSATQRGAGWASCCVHTLSCRQTLVPLCAIHPIVTACVACNLFVAASARC